MRQQIDDIAFSGNGSSVSEKFALEAGVMILHMTYSGSNYLIVNLYNESGYLRGMVDAKGTAAIPEDKIAEAVVKVFDLSPDGIMVIAVGESVSSRHRPQAEGLREDDRQELSALHRMPPIFSSAVASSVWPLRSSRTPGWELSRNTCPGARKAAPISLRAISGSMVFVAVSLGAFI